MEEADRQATMVQLVVLNQLEEVVELRLSIVNGVNHTLSSGERKDLRVDVFALGGEGDDKAARHRRLANQKHPVSVEMRL